MAVDDDPPRGRQAEAGALADVLGREERVEDALGQLLGDARAVVGDVDDQRSRRRARVEIVIVPLLAERVDRVVEQVRPHLVELGAAHGQLRQRAVVVAHELDRRCA